MFQDDQDVFFIWNKKALVLFILSNHDHPVLFFSSILSIMSITDSA